MTDKSPDHDARVDQAMAYQRAMDKMLHPTPPTLTTLLDEIDARAKADTYTAHDGSMRLKIVDDEKRRLVAALRHALYFYNSEDHAGIEAEVAAILSGQERAS